MAEFANQLNGAPGLVHDWHESARAKDPENVPAVNPEDPNFIGKLAHTARQLLLVSSSAKAAIQCEEDEDLTRRQKAMKGIADFANGMLVRTQWEPSTDGRYHLKKLLESPEETHPLVVAYLVFTLDDYLNQYRDIVHLGVCRVCGTVYLKPKHGQKMRYCSNSCRQKAYRKRQEKGGAKETKT
jgi:hypothetical protein